MLAFGQVWSYSTVWIKLVWGRSHSLGSPLIDIKLYFYPVDITDIWPLLFYFVEMVHSVYKAAMEPVGAYSLMFARSPYVMS